MATVSGKSPAPGRAAATSISSLECYQSSRWLNLDFAAFSPHPVFATTVVANMPLYGYKRWVWIFCCTDSSYLLCQSCWCVGYPNLGTGLGRCLIPVVFQQKRFPLLPPHFSEVFFSKWVCTFSEGLGDISIVVLMTLQQFLHRLAEMRHAETFTV